MLLASLILHELGHAYAAWRLGDPTAKLLGRLTLNPLAHLDALGTATLAITAFASTAVPGANVIFGWAKPVPVIQEYFRSRRPAMAIVAAAGPLVNVGLAVVLAAVAVHGGLEGRGQVVVLNALGLNIALVLFNLLPIPPLGVARSLRRVRDPRARAAGARPGRGSGLRRDGRHRPLPAARRRRVTAGRDHDGGRLRSVATRRGG